MFLIVLFLHFNRVRFEAEGEEKAYGRTYEEEKAQ
jgi:hypothetical protein